MVQAPSKLVFTDARTKNHALHRHFRMGIPLQRIQPFSKVSENEE